MKEPNQTLYIANIDWKVKKQVLKRALHTLFNRHGKIVEIIALRSDGLRGQAFVIFDSVSSATAALQAEQGFTFFGRDLSIQYSHEKSDKIAKKDGTFVPKDRRAKREAKEAAAVAALAAKKAKLNPDISVSVKDPSKLVVAEDEDDTKNTDNITIDPPAENDATPSNILFAQSLPDDCNEMMLACLFRSYAGYKEVRVPRTGLAFVEFDDEAHATVALKALNGFKLSANDSLDLKYGKS